VDSVHQDSGAGVRVHLQSLGVTDLSPSIPNFTAALKLLELRSRDHKLIPLVVDQTGIVEIMILFEDTPRAMAEDLALGAHRVLFAQHAGVYYLKHGQPNYEQIRQALHDAIAQSKRMKILNRLGPGIIAVYECDADIQGPVFPDVSS
jgi:hypothetical protein